LGEEGHNSLPLNETMEDMPKQRFIFAVFAAALLFSMVREWCAPVACVRAILLPITRAGSR
jgi:hypothetical protein